MTDAISNPSRVITRFLVNKYEDIDGARVNQDTARGRLAFRDSDGHMTLPRSLAEANKAVYPVDWAKPLNPGPWFDGPGLNGAPIYAVNDGGMDAQMSDFKIDPDVAYQTPWPAAIKQYDVYPALYQLPVLSGNKCLVYDEGTFTYGSGNLVGTSANYTRGSLVYAAFASGDEGKLTYTVSGAGVAVGVVVDVDVFGPNTVTVKTRGTKALG